MSNASRKRDLNRLLRIRCRLASAALVAGRYPCRLPSAYDKRDKSAAFRCFEYRDLVAEIYALDKAIRLFRDE